MSRPMVRAYDILTRQQTRWGKQCKDDAHVSGQASPPYSLIVGAGGGGGGGGDFRILDVCIHVHI